MTLISSGCLLMNQRRKARTSVLSARTMSDCRYYKISRTLPSPTNFRLKTRLISWTKLCHFSGKWWAMDLARLIISGRIWAFFFGLGGWSKVPVILRCLARSPRECTVPRPRVKSSSCWNGPARGNGKDPNGRKRKTSLKIDRRRTVFLAWNADGRRYRSLSQLSAFARADGDAVSVLCNSASRADDQRDAAWGLVCVNRFLTIVRPRECCKKYENKIYIELCSTKHMANSEDKSGLACQKKTDLNDSVSILKVCVIYCRDSSFWTFCKTWISTYQSLVHLDERQIIGIFESISVEFLCA